MKAMKTKLRKGAAFLLAFVLGISVLPMMPGSKLVAQAAAGSEPSVTAYATTEQLMSTFQVDETNTVIGKIAFGKDYVGNALEWYILGKDSGVVGNNIAIFAASFISTEIFTGNYDEKIFDASFGTYASNPATVYPNHYGSSSLRTALQELAVDTKYFTLAEQSLMQATAVTTADIKNDTAYVTTDKLYALNASNDSSCLLAGSKDDKELPPETYWSNGNPFWLRMPCEYNTEFARLAVTWEHSIKNNSVTYNSGVRPASNIKLTSVSFASAAKPALSDTVVAGTIPADAAMTLRLDGSNSNIGSVVYDVEKGYIMATKGNTTDMVSLVVQGNDGTTDWYYSKMISENAVVNVTDIKTALEPSKISDVDLASCKIWLETTTDNVTYAVNGEENTAGTIKIAMGDWGGDGWNGASITVKEDEKEVGTYTIEGGHNNSVEIPYNLCMSYSFNWNNGYRDSECSFTISLNGESYYECAYEDELESGWSLEIERKFDHAFETETQSCIFCGQICGIDFQHVIEDGMCTRCRKTLVCSEITVESMEHGTVEIPEEAFEGQKIDLLITPHVGYVLSELKVTTRAGEEVTVTNNSFVMPAEPVIVTASFRKDGGDFVVGGEDSGWYLEDGVLHFAQAGAYSVSMAPGKESTNQIIVVDAADVILTLDNIYIEAPNGGQFNVDEEYEENMLVGKSALITGGFTTDLILVGTNVLTGGNSGYTYCGAGYYVKSCGCGIDGNVNISGDGMITLRGGNGADNAISAENADGGHGISGNVILYGGKVISCGGDPSKDLEYCALGTPGRAFGSLSVPEGRTLVLTAGASEEKAETKDVYDGEKFAVAGVVANDDEKHQVIIAESENGTVASDKESGYENELVKLTVTPDEGYSILSMTVQDAEGNEIILGERGAFYMPASSVTVTVEFAVEVGDFYVQGAKEGYGYDENTGVLSITQSGEYAVYMKRGLDCTGDVIKVTAEDVTLTLHNVKIYAPAGSMAEGKNALTLSGLTALNVVGECVLQGGNASCDYHTQVTWNGGYGISGDIVLKGGTLEVIGGNAASSTHLTTGDACSGICGSVTMVDGTLVVKGGKGGDVPSSLTVSDGAAAITGDILLQNGIIRATGGEGGSTSDGTIKGNSGKAVGGTITTVKGKDICVVAGADEESATEIQTYTDETYVQFTTKEHEHVDEDMDGKCDAENCGDFVDGIGASLAGYTLSLNGNIGVNFYMELDEAVAENADAYMQFTLNGKEYQQVKVSDAEEKEVNDKTYRVFKCGIPAKDMEKPITAQMVLDENSKGTVYNFTVKEYADYILDENHNYNDATKAVVEAMLTYGEYAKAYFGKETLTATKEIANVTTETLKEYAAEVTNDGTRADNAPYYGSSLLLESEVVLRHYFTQAVEGAIQAGSYWYKDIANIPAHKLHENTVTTVEGVTISYSPLSYAYAALKAGSYGESLENLVKAMYLYNRAACEYVDSETNSQ